MSAGQIVILGVAVAAIALGGLYMVARSRLPGQGGKSKFKAKALLTANELEFLSRLEEAVPEFRFCPQVAMGALLDPDVSKKEGRDYYRLRGMFSQKVVDFVAQNRHDGAVVAVIELDDRTHNKDKDAKRDNMLSDAGYRVVRWHSRNKPDAQTIRSSLMGPSSNQRAHRPL